MVVGVSLTDSAGRGEAELEASPTQQSEIKSGCLTATLGSLPTDRKNQISGLSTKLQSDLATSSDDLTSQRARISEQRKRLQEELNLLGDAGKNVADFNRLASPAIQSCSEASAASQVIKANSNVTAARAAEIKYQLILLTSLDGQLAQQQQDVQKTIGTLDRVRGALMVGV
jgi:hypothetical protein